MSFVRFASFFLTLCRRGAVEAGVKDENFEGFEADGDGAVLRQGDVFDALVGVGAAEADAAFLGGLEDGRAQGDAARLIIGVAQRERGARSLRHEQ